MDADVANILNGQLASAAQASHQRLNIIGENAAQGLAVVQNTGIQIANGAILSGTVMADDAQAAMGLRAVPHVPVKDGSA